MHSLETSKVILLVNSDQDVRFTLMLLLKRSGYAVVEAASGQEAVKILRAARRTGAAIDLMVADLDMEGTSGAGLAEEIERAGFILPILILTGCVVSRRDTLRLRKWTCLPKPFDVSALLDRVEGLLCWSALENLATHNREMPS